MSKRKKIKVEYKTLVVIWLALLASQLLFFAIVYVVNPDLVSAEPPESILGTQPLITLVFAASATVFFILSVAIGRQHMRRAIQDRDAGCLQTGLVIGCALSEIASILGVILALFLEYPYFYLWIALGALGIILNFPRKGSLEAALSQDHLI